MIDAITAAALSAEIERQLTRGLVDSEGLEREIARESAELFAPPDDPAARRLRDVAASLGLSVSFEHGTYVVEDKRTGTQWYPQTARELSFLLFGARWSKGESNAR